MTRWEQFYLEDERVLSAPPSHCVKDAVHVYSKNSKHTILDVGCGVGRDASYLVKSGFSVVGIDAAESGLRIANHLSGEKRQDSMFVRADARQLPFPSSSFGGVYCFGLLHEFTGDDRESDVRRVMEEIHRVLEISGVLILSVLSGEPEQGLPHVYLFTEREFDDATQDFEVVKKEESCDIGCTGKDDYQVWRGVFAK